MPRTPAPRLLAVDVPPETQDAREKRDLAEVGTDPRMPLVPVRVLRVQDVRAERCLKPVDHETGSDSR
jgi:hypothetical protein